MPSSSSDPIARYTIVALAVLAAVCLLAVTIEPSWAQTNPFGGPRAPAGPPPATGIIGWVLAKQSAFYQQFAGLIRAAKADGSAVWGLLGVSFLYGVFHAAGPGHGKAVISSYLVANEETWRRGVVLSLASALLQALVAIAVVGLASLLFQATRKAMCDADYYLEIASYGLIALVGARLTWVKGRSLLAARMAHATPGHGPHDHAAHGHHHDHAHGAHDHHAHDDAGHDHAHHHDDHAGHSHGPEPQELAGPGGWHRGLSAVVAVGARPCSGAIIVLVFALTQGLFWVGAASTIVMGLGTALTVAAIATLAVTAKGIAKRLAAHNSGAGSLAMHGIEVGAAVLVLLFGIALMLGYMTTERLMMACG